MNTSEIEILDQIEQGLLQDDAAFAKRMTFRPGLSTWDKVRFAVFAYVGIITAMFYQVHVGLAVAGYAVLVTATIDLVRRRRLAVEPAGRAGSRSQTALLEPSFD